MSNVLIFKSRLMEYTQKASLPQPVYESTKEGPAHDPKFKATVTVNRVRYDSSSNFSNRKSAEHAAAQVALENLQKKSNGEIFVSCQVESRLCKNLLQVYAQKMSLPVPVYKYTMSGENHSPIFISTVEVAGTSYTGGIARNKKDAEIKAAQKAWMAIQTQSCYSVSQPATANISASQTSDLNIRGPQTPNLNISDSKHETGLWKNLLQEYTQKMHLPLPLYRSKRSGEIHSPIFVTTVEIAGICYTGDTASTKKEAEIKAARKALTALQTHGDSISRTAT